MTERTPCRTPAGKSATNIPTWKFDACRAALLAELTGGPVPAKDIAARAGERLSAPDRDALGALGWHMTTVRLEMEVRRELERIPGQTPVTLRRPR
ncbi:DUF6958 family protein [Jannaschia sp. LMIT008]|uniref:DUF6958 family protein n=1 Tax=Jannaschia maritima TaxID=3032585 RepID=UPI0028114506|nr:hypothetical protein [Jannaschia sp. LMIT008]